MIMGFPFECPVCGHKTNMPQTNADRIRAMSDEELAEFLCGVFDDDYCGVHQDECGKFINGTVILDYDQYKIAEWLKQPDDMRGEEDAYNEDLQPLRMRI
jgi:hypothetical protein